MWSTDTQVLQTFSSHAVSDVRSRPAFNRGESAVLAGDEDGKLWAWNVLDAKPLQGFPSQPHRRAITGVLCNLNGQEMVTASLGELLRSVEAYMQTGRSKCGADDTSCVR